MIYILAPILFILLGIIIFRAFNTDEDESRTQMGKKRFWREITIRQTKEG